MTFSECVFQACDRSSDVKSVDVRCRYDSRSCLIKDLEGVLRQSSVSAWNDPTRKPLARLHAGSRHARFSPAVREDLKLEITQFYVSHMMAAQYALLLRSRNICAR
jgi:hypothetical protein